MYCCTCSTLYLLLLLFCYLQNLSFGLHIVNSSINGFSLHSYSSSFSDVSGENLVEIILVVSDKFLETFRPRHVALIEHDEASPL